MAQELRRLFPDFVYERVEESDVLHVDYAGLSVVAIKAIQELKYQVDALSAELQDVNNQLVKTNFVSLI